MRFTCAFLLAMLLSTPLAAQTRSPDTPAVSFRPFFLAAGEQFAASKTFDAVFGPRSMQPFFGGGVQVALKQGVFVELAVSRFKQTGERAVVVDGQVYRLGIPLTATITPIEITGGYRFTLSRVIRPYAAAGVGRYRYAETSTFNEAGEDVDASQIGFVVMGGAEVRLHRWVGVAVDAQYTRVSGILGDAGISKEFGEKDLGGTAVRVKVLVGR